MADNPVAGGMRVNVEMGKPGTLKKVGPLSENSSLISRPSSAGMIGPKHFRKVGDLSSNATFKRAGRISGSRAAMRKRGMS